MLLATIKHLKIIPLTIFFFGISIPLFAQSFLTDANQYPFYFWTPFLFGVILSLCVFGLFLWKRQQKINIKREQEITEAISTIRESLTHYVKEEEEEEEVTQIFGVDQETHQKEANSANEEWLKLLNKNANLLIEDGKFSIIDLAESMNLSERQFRRRLKQNTNLVPAAYLREIRLQKAMFCLKIKFILLLLKYVVRLDSQLQNTFRNYFRNDLGIILPFIWKTKRIPRILKINTERVL